MARLIVCERSGQWSVAMRSELGEAGIRVWECRSLPEAWEALAKTPAAFVIAEATRENLDSLLRRMAWFSRDFPEARIAVVAPRTMVRFQWLCARRGQSIFLYRPGNCHPWPPW